MTDFHVTLLLELVNEAPALSARREFIVAVHHGKETHL